MNEIERLGADLDKLSTGAQRMKESFTAPGRQEVVSMESAEFQEFPKIARLKRGIVVTEKIDGTNASVWIGEIADGEPVLRYWQDNATGRLMGLRAGSRTRWITPEDDNYGFARWVQDNAEALRGLGEGHHFGEWWGNGIQRRYGQAIKRFSLFNVGRWADTIEERDANLRGVANPGPRPWCCDVVPVLYCGDMDTRAIEATLERLRTHGSAAAPGFMAPEGVVVYHAASRMLFKQTLDKNDGHKGTE